MQVLLCLYVGMVFVLIQFCLEGFNGAESYSVKTDTNSVSSFRKKTPNTIVPV